jgi:hypothetical protein
MLRSSTVRTRFGALSSECEALDAVANTLTLFKSNALKGTFDAQLAAVAAGVRQGFGRTAAKASARRVKLEACSVLLFFRRIPARHMVLAGISMRDGVHAAAAGTIEVSLTPGAPDLAGDVRCWERRCRLEK